jgi:hypothetical protein
MSASEVKSSLEINDRIKVLEQRLVLVNYLNTTDSEVGHIFGNNSILATDHALYMNWIKEIQNEINKLRSDDEEITRNSMYYEDNYRKFSIGARGKNGADEQGDK